MRSLKENMIRHNDHEEELSEPCTWGITITSSSGDPSKLMLSMMYRVAWQQRLLDRYKWNDGGPISSDVLQGRAGVARGNTIPT